jgi:putative ABC transport system permease protein
VYARLLGWSFRHRRGRSLINVLALATTASIVIIFVSVMLDLRAYVRKNEGGRLTRIILIPKMTDAELPLALDATLKSIDGIEEILHYRAFGGRHENGTRYVIVGEEAKALPLTADFFPVAADVAAAWNAKKTGAIVSPALAKALRLEPGRIADIPTPRGALRVEIVGTSSSALSGNRMVVHYEYLHEFVGNPGTTNYRVFSRPENFERVARAVDERTRNCGMPVHAISSTQDAVATARQASMVPMILGFLGLILLVTTTLTLANNTGIAIRERLQETATMRVLGYRRGTILRMLLAEGLLVGLAGALIAVVVTTVAFRGGIQLTPGEITQLKPTHVTLVGAIGGIAMALLVVLAGTLLPAIRAVRTPLVDALRDTE